MDGHPCGDTRQNPGYVGSRPLPGPATSAGLVVSGGSWHVGVSGIGISGIGAYRSTHVPTPALLQLANRASHLLPTLTSHPESTQPSTDTHDSLSVGRSRGIFGETAHADNADLYGLDTGTTGESRQSAKSDGPREPSSCSCANHPRARPTSHATVFVRDRPRAQPSSHRLVVLHTISPSTVLRTRPSSHSTVPTRMHPSSVANRKTRRARRQLRCTPPRAPPRPHDETWSPKAAMPGHAVGWRIRASRL